MRTDDDDLLSKGEIVGVFDDEELGTVAVVIEGGGEGNLDDLFPGEHFEENGAISDHRANSDVAMKDIVGMSSCSSFSNLPPTSSAPPLDNCSAVSEEAQEPVCTVKICPTNPLVIVAGAQDDTARVYNVPPSLNLLKPDAAESSNSTITTDRRSDNLRVMLADDAGVCMLPNFDEPLADESPAASAVFGSTSWSVVRRRERIVSSQGERLKRNMAPTKVLSGMHTDTVSAVAYSHDAKYCCTAGYDGRLHVYDATEDQFSLVSTLEGVNDLEVEWCQWHPKGHAIIAGVSDGNTWMWWGPSGAVMRVFAGHRGSVLCGSFSPDGKKVCTGGSDGVAVIFDPKSGASVHRLDDIHSNPILCLATYNSFQENQAPIMATGSEDALCKLTNIDTGKVVATLSAHTDSVNALEFNRNYNEAVVLATGGMDGSVNVWNCGRGSVMATMKHDGWRAAAQHGTPLSPVATTRGGVTAVHWHPTEQTLLFSSSTDGTLRLWDIRSSKCEALLCGHSEAVLDFAVANIGPVFGTEAAAVWGCRVASASDDCTVRLWDLVQI